MMPRDDTDAPRIITTEDVLGGKPRIAGRRIGVRFVREQAEGRGLDAQTVADRFDLDVADVYHALAYFYDHPEEMAEIERERHRRHEVAESDPTVAMKPSDLP